MNANATQALASQLADAALLSYEAPAGSVAEARATGAVFALVRLARSLEIFDEVAATAAEELGQTAEEFAASLPADEETEDARGLIGA